MRNFLAIVLLFSFVSLCPIAEGYQGAAPPTRKEKLHSAKSRTAKPGECAGAFIYGNSETQTFYSGTNPKRYRLSMWWYAVGDIQPSWDPKAGKHSGAKVALDGNAPRLEVPFAPSSIDVEAKQMDMLFPGAPTSAPVQAVCFEDLP